MSWENKKWLVIGDSLSDDGAAYQNAVPKYYHNISSATGIQVVKSVQGGTGYWNGYKTGREFCARIAELSSDSAVSVVTVFGSVNDWKFHIGGVKRTGYYEATAGLDKSGNLLTFNKLVELNNKDSLTFSREFLDEHLSYDDTVASTIDMPAENASSSVSVVAYINEVINLLHQKYPNAKIVLVDEIFFRGTYGVRFDADLSTIRRIKKAIVEKRVLRGDTWLSLVELEKSVYGNRKEAIGDWELTNLIPGHGLSFGGPNEVTESDRTSDKRQLNNDAFRAKYSADDAGHPNPLYHRIWLSPIFAHIVGVAIGETVTDSALMMTAQEQADLDALWINKPSGEPVPPTQTYTATFFAEGFGVVDTVEFEAGATVLPRVPTVPYKEGYTGEWEQYTLADADITINAVYTPVQPDAIAYDINGDEIYNAYDINGASITKLYDINGESLV